MDEDYIYTRISKAEVRGLEEKFGENGKRYSIILDKTHEILGGDLFLQLLLNTPNRFDMQNYDKCLSHLHDNSEILKADGPRNGMAAILENKFFLSRQELWVINPSMLMQKYYVDYIWLDRIKTPSSYMPPLTLGEKDSLTNIFSHFFAQKGYKNVSTSPHMIVYTHYDWKNACKLSAITETPKGHIGCSFQMIRMLLLGAPLLTKDFDSSRGYSHHAMFEDMREQALVLAQTDPLIGIISNTCIQSYLEALKVI